MPKLVLNYMRPMAMVLLLAITMVIACSFFLIPKPLALSLPYFYYQFWHKLTLLFAIAVLFLGNAFYPGPVAIGWLKHLFAILLIGWFLVEIMLLVRVGNIFLAFV